MAPGRLHRTFTPRIGAYLLLKYAEYDAKNRLSLGRSVEDGK